MTIKETIQTKFKQYRADSDAATDPQDKVDLAIGFSEYIGGYLDAAKDFNIAAEDIKPATVALRVARADIEKIESDFALEELLA
jgi:hypothetical protein